MHGPRLRSYAQFPMLLLADERLTWSLSPLNPPFAAILSIITNFHFLLRGRSSDEGRINGNDRRNRSLKEAAR